MSVLRWTQAMSVGVEALDTDHKCLVRIINLLKDTEPKSAATVIETVLETLLIYARFHFQREEKVMEACGFTGLPFHRAEHEGFARFVRALRQQVHEGATLDMAHTLYDYLTRWLCHHVLIQDMAFKPLVCGGQELEQLALTAAPALDTVSVPPAACAGG